MRFTGFVAMAAAALIAGTALVAPAAAEDRKDWPSEITIGTASQGGAYLLPYLQSGHILLLGVLLLASTISYPGDREPA